MSRIYDNSQLSTLPIKTNSWSKLWDPSVFKRGNGILAEGTIQDLSRLAVTDVNQQKVRYYILHVKLRRAHRRQFKENGQEIEPNFSEKGKVRTGYLHSSYKSVDRGETDELSIEAAARVVENAELAALSGHTAGCVSLWLTEVLSESVEVNTGLSVRLRTSGDSPFIESIALLDNIVQGNTVSNFAGGASVGGSWTDKVMQVKSAAASEPSQPEGVDEDEWDD